jgi:hypothetical protein
MRRTPDDGTGTGEEAPSGMIHRLIWYAQCSMLETEAAANQLVDGEERQKHVELKYNKYFVSRRSYKI